MDIQLLRKPTLSVIAMLAGLAALSATLVIWPSWVGLQTEIFTGSGPSASAWQAIETDRAGRVVRTYYNPVSTIGILGLLSFGLMSAAAAAFQVRNGFATPSKSSDAALQEILESHRRELEQELATILGLVQSYLSANATYSGALTKARTLLPSLATQEQIRVMIKFLIAENEKMHREVTSLDENLTQSKNQVKTLKSDLAEAEELTIRDPLTSLINRRGFDKKLPEHVAAARKKDVPMCLVMADIDHFKKINDTFGHLVGDEVLKLFSKLLNTVVTKRDVVTRFGGEEFAIILAERELKAAKALTEAIRIQLANQKWIVNKTGEPIGKITASFGIAQIGRGDDANSILTRADSMLYDAKQAGRDLTIADGDTVERKTA